MSCIEKHFQELKNTSRSKEGSAYQQGLFCEQLVAVNYFQKGYQLLAHRFRTRFSEIDLVFKDSNSRVGKSNPLICIEVKSLSSNHWGNIRVSAQQKKRLLRARLYLEMNLKSQIEFHLALVRKTGKIEIIRNFLC